MNVKDELINIKPKGTNTFHECVVHSIKGTGINIKLFFQGMRIPIINAENFSSHLVHPLA